MQALGVSWGERKGRRRAAAAMATAAALLVPGSASSGTTWTHSSALQQVIVQALPGAIAQAERAVTSAGGRITRELGIVNGFAATVPADTTSGLRSNSGVLAVTPDVTLHLQGSSYSPATDPGAPAAVQAATGATTFWNNGYYGQGIGVAVIDSGVVPEDGLRQNVFYGPDFTPQALNPTLRFLDTYGHGTFMASLIGGRADAATRPYTNSDNFVGMAPESTLVSVKVADATGATSESAVVSAVQWVTQHMYDSALQVSAIKVINLSVGVPNTGYQHDPLAAAVERAWSAGITVVSSAGNSGTSGLTLPAADPYVIAVGAVDNNDTLDPGDDSVASFSNTGNDSRNPDLVAPGTHIVGLRDAGSYIDTTYGSTGRVTSTLFRGSGTSEASAIVSGAAALLLSENPSLSPDDVKDILTDSATPLAGESRSTEGAGEVNLTAAYSQTPDSNDSQSFPHAYGFYARTGGWLAGGSWYQHIWQAPSWGGERSIESGTLSDVHWNGVVWTGVVWTGVVWTGVVWTGVVWTGVVWTGVVWTGATWQ